MGNAAYKSMPPLGTPVTDARSVCARFKQLGFDTECVEDARTRREMRSAVQRYVGRMKPGAVAVFYFAGHGVQKRGENYLLPVEAQIDRVSDVDEEAMSLGYLMEAVSELKPSLNLVIVDACRDNMVERARELALPRGFSAIDAPANSAVFYSTAPGKVAFDSGKGAARGYSPFAFEFLKRMEDDSQPLEEVFKRVIAGVQVATAGQQVPWVNSSFSGSFCFGACVSRVNAVEVARISAEKQDVEAKLRLLEAERDRRESDFDALARRIRELESQTQARQKEVDGLRDAGRQSSSGYADQNRQLQLELEVLRQANLELSRERAAIFVQRQEARRLEAVSQELSQRLKQIEQLQSDNALLRKRADDLNKEIDALQSQERANVRRSATQERETKAPPPPAF